LAGSGDTPLQLGYSPPGPDDHDGIDPFWYQEPDPVQFRSQLPASGSVPGQYAPARPAADRDRQLRYEQTASGALPQVDRRYPGELATTSLWPAGGHAEPGSPPARPGSDWPLPEEFAADDESYWLLPVGGARDRAVRDPLSEPDRGALSGPDRSVLSAASRPPGPFGPPVPTMPPPTAPPVRTHRLRGDQRVSQRSETIHGRRALSPRSTDPDGRLGTRRTIRMAATTALLFIAAGIVAAVVVLVIGHHGTAGHSPPAGRGSATAGPSGPAQANGLQPTVSGLVTVEPEAATAPQEAAVVTFLNRYFRAINRHTFGAYELLFTPARRVVLSAGAFSSSYGMTRDSAVTLHSIEVTGARQADALVTFTSHRRAGVAPSSCTAWTISLHLVKRGHGYLLESLPDGHQAFMPSCS
jgi:hypothetical protein